MTRSDRDAIVGLLAVAAFVLAGAVLAMLGCSAIPGVRDVPKPARLVVERAGCEAAFPAGRDRDACLGLALILGARDGGADAAR